MVFYITPNNQGDNSDYTYDVHHHRWDSITAYGSFSLPVL